MANPFNTGVTALLTYQRSLTTTGHNISNANTPGYSRQRVALETQIPERLGFGYIGGGVKIQGVERLNNQFLTLQLQQQTAESSRLQTFLGLTGQVDNLVADDQGGLSPSMQRFFGSLQDVANEPGSVAARQVLLSDAQGLIDRFGFFDGQLDGMSQDINQRMVTLTDTINSIATNIATLNESIVASNSGTNTAAPNDLLDQRDQLITDLSELVAVSTIDESSGARNVFVGNGQILVFGTDARQLTTIQDPENFSQFNIAYVTPAGNQDITALLAGGELGGLLDFRHEVLNPSRSELGRIAMVLSSTFNSQHESGLDLNGLVGTDFFNTPAPNVITNLNNTGSATVTATVTDYTSLTTSDYRLSYDGVNYTLTRLSDNSSVSGPGPLTMDGLSVAIGVGAANGDSFIVQPTQNGAGTISLAINNVNNFSAAGLVRTSADLSNLGSAEITFNQVLNASDPDVFDTVEIVFNNPPTTFDVLNITDASTIASGVGYLSGADIDVNGVRVNISGAAEAGDTFILQQNSNATNDNRNALALARLQTGLFVNGTATYEGAFAALVGRVGTQARQSEINGAAQRDLLNQIQTRRDEVSGVNLDEEAADLLRFQQAYEAAAQVIAVADNLFETLLGAVRR